MGQHGSKTRRRETTKQENVTAETWQAQPNNIAPPTVHVTWHSQQHGFAPPTGPWQAQQNSLTPSTGLWQDQHHNFAATPGTWQVQQYNFAPAPGLRQTPFYNFAPPTVTGQAQQQNFSPPPRMWQTQQRHLTLVPVVWRPQQQNLASPIPGQHHNQAHSTDQKQVKQQTKEPSVREKAETTKRKQREVPPFKEKPLALWDKPSVEMLGRLARRQTEEGKISPENRIVKEVKYSRNYADFVCGTYIWTTAREKNLVKLESRDRNLPADVIRHVIEGYCSKKVHAFNENYICCFGFVLKRGDVTWHDFENCRNFHKLTNDLKCYNGKIYYPVDAMINPLEHSETDAQMHSKNAQKVHEVINRTWPYTQYFGDDADTSCFTSFEERYLIHLMNSGLDVPDEVISHVVRGCEAKPHMISKTLGCCYGFILTRSEFYSHDAAMKDPENQKNAHVGRVIGPDGKPVRNQEHIDFIQCEVNHKLNDKIDCSHGILFYSLYSCRSPCRVLRSQRMGDFLVRFTDIPGVRSMYYRLKYKSQMTSKDGKWYENLRPWEEYLLKLLVHGEIIPVEVISHVIDGLDGCYIGAHLLDDDFGCCHGYILTRREFMSHDFNQCKIDHSLNEELRCNKGLVYHITAPKVRPSTAMPHLGGQPRRERNIIDIVTQADIALALPPPAPAPPPPDVME